MVFLNFLNFDWPELPLFLIDFIWTYLFFILRYCKYITSGFLGECWKPSSVLARYSSLSWAAPLRDRTAIGQITPISTFHIFALLLFLLH